jgi:hypothetical protein
LTSLKRLRFAQNSWIDVERSGGKIVGGTAPNWLGGRVRWSAVAVGRPVQVMLWERWDRPSTSIETRPLESMAVIE